MFFFKAGGKLKNISFFLLLLSCLFFTDRIYDSYQLTKSFSFIFLSSIILFFALISCEKLRFPFHVIPVLIYFLYICFLFFFKAKNPVSFYTAVYLAPLVFFIPFFIRINPEKITFFISAAAVLAALFAFFQLLQGTGRPYSFFGNPIFFGEFMMACVPIILCGLILSRGKTAVYYAISFAFTVTGVFLSASRGVYISFIISLMFFILFFIKNPKILFSKLKLPAAVFIIVILILLTAPQGRDASLKNINRVVSVFTSGEYSQAVTNRLMMIKSAVPLFITSPVIGSGPGSYKYYYQKNQAELLLNNENYSFISTSAVHNDYIQLLAETGLIGLLLFLISVFSVLLYSERIKPFLSDKKYIFYAALFSAVSAFLVESFFNFPIFIFPSALLFWLFLGMLCVLCTSSDKNVLLLSIRKKQFLLILLILFSAAVIALNPPGFISGFFLKHAIELDSKNDPSNELYFKKAQASLKNNYYAYFFIAGSYTKSLKFNEAVKSYREALSIYPYSSDVMYNIGTIFFAQKDYKQAASWFVKALELHPRFALARLYLAKCFISMGNDQLASYELLKAYKADPGLVTGDSEKYMRLFLEEKEKNTEHK